MRVALSSSGKTLDDNLSDVFARCPYFIIVEVSNQKLGEVEVLENLSMNHMGGAGVSVAQTITEKGIDSVITGNVGPRALEVLRQFNIDIYRGKGILREVIQDFIKGKLEKI